MVSPNSKYSQRLVLSQVLWQYQYLHWLYGMLLTADISSLCHLSSRQQG